MAESQLVCLDDDHVNEKIPESKAEFYYSEEQRAALEQLLRNGDGAFKMRLKEDNIKDFLSAREVKSIRKTFYEYTDADSDSESEDQGKSKESPSADSGVHSTYWPQMSDTAVPSLDLGWSGSSGIYRGVTRVCVYTHPPKEPGPHIKEVVRRLIQESHKVLAIVMDHLTDLLILQDLLDAARRGVAVYVVLEAKGVPHFLDMCTRLQINAMHVRNLRVRTVKGSGLALSFGKLPGCLCSKYMLVDGEKVMFGSYSFTWSSSRMNRNMITVMSGQVVDFFDNDFRELYAVSQEVDLHREFNITKPPISTPVRKPSVEKISLPPVSKSRFQVPVGDTKGVDMKVPVHKYHNPKYSLVFGNSMGFTGSLQDLSCTKELLVNGVNERNNLQSNKLHASKNGMVQVGRETQQRSGSPAEDRDEDGKGSLKRSLSFGAKKERSSFRHFLKGRGINHGTDTIEEDVVTPQSPSPSLTPTPTPIPKLKSKLTPTPILAPKVSETNGIAEREDSFDINEKPSPLKFKPKKPSKAMQRSMSLMTLNGGDEDGLKSRRRHLQKKNCIQS